MNFDVSGLRVDPSQVVLLLSKRGLTMISFVYLFFPKIDDDNMYYGERSFL